MMGGKVRSIGSGRCVANVASHDDETSDVRIGQIEISKKGLITNVSPHLPAEAFIEVKRTSFGAYLA
jgi:hypothetical protein